MEENKNLAEAKVVEEPVATAEKETKSAPLNASVAPVVTKTRQKLKKLMTGHFQKSWKTMLLKVR